MEQQSAQKSPSWGQAYFRLRTWFRIYLLVWLGGIVLVIIGGGIASQGPEKLGGAIAIVGAVFFFGSLIPYVVSMTLAYKVQKGLRNDGYIKSGPWQVLVAALILNPYLIGFYVPLSVINAARSALNG